MSRRTDERGGVLVELALVAPVLMVLIVGIIDFGIMFSEQISFRTGVREASWNSSRAILGSTDGCPLTFSGAPPPDSTQRIMCMVKDRSDLPDADRDIRVSVRLVDFGDLGAMATFGVGKGVMVCAMRNTRSVTSFFTGLLDGRVQRYRLTNVIIAVDTANPLSTGEETPLPGENWNWCDPGVAPPP